MNHNQFMDMLDVAWDDFRAHSGPTAIGMAVVILHRDENDDLEVQVGSNVPPEVVRYALTNLVLTWNDGGAAFTTVEPRPKRKVV